MAVILNVEFAVSEMGFSSGHDVLGASSATCLCAAGGGTGTGASFYIFVYSHFSEAGLHFNKGVTRVYLRH